MGAKTEQGFFKKVKAASGKSEIHALDLKTLTYHPSQKIKFATLENTKTIDNLKDRVKVLISGKDKAGEFYRASLGLFKYVSNRIPEISDDIYKIDDAMKAGFGWELGPFEYWDAIGVKESVAMMEASGNKPAKWIFDFLAAGNSSFYKIENRMIEVLANEGHSARNISNTRSAFNHFRDAVIDFDTNMAIQREQATPFQSALQGVMADNARQASCKTFCSSS